ncbi:MAG: protein-ADP-ribose hydrolase [Selenomonadaceae bacterium]
MERLEEILQVNKMLLEDQPQYKEDALRVPRDVQSQRRLMRSLMNVRYPRSLPEALIKAQDALLAKEREEKGVVHVSEIPSTATSERIKIWQGDITRLDVDAIVNAANSAMLGCFVPCHGCIDNAIHSAAGLELREECAEIMKRQGHEEPTGRAKITAGYNLPTKHVIHTVGPIIYGVLTREDEQLLASCYRSCLELASREGLESITFCCISTGEFHFPNRRAAEIAVETVKKFLNENTQIKMVVFNVFKDIDAKIYHELLDEVK